MSQRQSKTCRIRGGPVDTVNLLQVRLVLKIGKEAIANMKWVKVSCIKTTRGSLLNQAQSFFLFGVVAVRMHKLSYFRLFFIGSLLLNLVYNKFSGFHSLTLASPSDSFKRQEA